MTAQQPQRWKLAAAPVAVVAAIVAALSVSELRINEAYWDHLGGVWTICAGVTGPDVVKGIRLTDEQCQQRETEYVQKMLGRMGKCVTTELTFGEIKAWGHFAYNVGNANFCGSTAAKLLNQGRRKEACAQISRWVFIKEKDCRVAASKCSGIPKRRAGERGWCESEL